jgi:hypothetical protein
MVREGKVFGHKIYEKGIKIDESGIEPLRELPRPQDIKSLQTFVGHAGFYRCFIKNFANIVAPLTHLFKRMFPLFLKINVSIILKS